jgi:hypothetical protein
VGQTECGPRHDDRTWNTDCLPSDVAPAEIEFLSEDSLKIHRTSSLYPPTPGPVPPQDPGVFPSSFAPTPDV